MEYKTNKSRRKKGHLILEVLQPQLQISTHRDFKNMSGSYISSPLYFDLAKIGCDIGEIQIFNLFPLEKRLYSCDPQEDGQSLLKHKFC